MPHEPHLWESVAGEVGDWMDQVPDQIAQDIIGEHRPWEPAMTHDDQMAYHLEHLYPPQLGGQLDPSYIAHILTTGTKDEKDGLQQALDRYVTKRADAQGASGLPPPSGRLAPYQPPATRAPQPPRRY